MPIPAPTPASSRSSARVLAIRDYRFFLAGTGVGALIAQTQAVAAGWDVYERTQSALALGAIGLAQFLPAVLLFLPAGQLADRLDRRRLMAASMAIFALGAAGLAVSAAVGASVLATYCFLAAASAAHVMGRPARDSLLPHLVPGDALGQAVALNTSVFQVASIVGPTAAGLAIATTHSAVPVYATNAVLALAAAGLTLAIRARVIRSTRPAATPRELFAGLVHVWRTRLILAVITLDLFAVLFGGATALLPLYAKDILHVGPAGLGWLTAAPAVGAVTMALFVAHAPPFTRTGPTFIAAVAGYGLATIVFGLSTAFWLSLAALVLVGACDNISVVVRQTVVQLRTPDALRGRVSAVNRVFISSSNELGALESGLVAALTDPVFAVVSGGIATVLIVAATPKVFPELARLRGLHQ